MAVAGINLKSVRRLYSTIKPIFCVQFLCFYKPMQNNGTTEKINDDRNNPRGR